jgi:hypothetical protein
LYSFGATGSMENPPSVDAMDIGSRGHMCPPFFLQCPRLLRLCSSRVILPCPSMFDRV